MKHWDGEHEGDSEGSEKVKNMTEGLETLPGRDAE